MYLIAIVVVVFILLTLSLKVVKEYDRGVIFFLGKVTGVRGPGLIILIPILEQMTKVTLRTITMNIPSQKIITKDNVSIDIAAVAYYHVVDPTKSIKAAYRVAARPQTYFVDRTGVIRAVQIGGLTDADFERSYAKIAR